MNVKEEKNGKRGKGKKNLAQVGKATHETEDKKGSPGMYKIYMLINFSMIKTILGIINLF